MNIEFIVIGKTKENYLAEAVDDFKKRLSRYCQISISVIKERKGRFSEQERIDFEGKQILAKVPANSFVILLDRSGEKIKSKKLAKLLSNWKENHPQLTVIIGGYLGVSKEVIINSNYVLSLSEMTFTHDMARFIVMEQLYRAFSIISGTKYHK